MTTACFPARSTASINSRSSRTLSRQPRSRRKPACLGQPRLNSIPHAVQHQHGQQLIAVAHESNCSVITKVVPRAFLVKHHKSSAYKGWWNHLCLPHRIVKTIYAEATGMVRLRLPSGETLCSEPFPVRRGVIQGDIFSPQCFTLGLDRIFRLHDIAGQGIGGPFLGDVTASKLEYADDVGLLDWTAAEASERVSALARGLRTSASMEMSAPNRKACMCTPESDYLCRRKWRLRLLTSHTAAPNARGVVYRQGRSTIFRMPIYPMLNQCQ